MSDGLDIPEFLKREDTPESKRARELIVKQRGVRRVVKSDSRSSISTGYASLANNETGKEILREMLKSGEMTDAAHKRAVRALRKRSNAVKTGAKEKALKEVRETIASLVVDEVPANVPVATEAAAKPTTTKKEKGVVTTKTKKSVENARTRVNGKTHAERSDGLRPGSKMAMLMDAAVAAGKEGTTYEKLAKKIDWKSVHWQLKDLCKRVHAKLEDLGDGRVVVTPKR